MLVDIIKHNTILVYSNELEAMLMYSHGSCPQDEWVCMLALAAKHIGGDAV